MKPIGSARCPYCRHEEEGEVDGHQILTCSKCKERYHAHLSIRIITYPVGEGGE